VPATYKQLLDYLQELDSQKSDKLNESILIYDKNGCFHFAEFLEMEVEEVQTEKLVIFIIE